MTTRAQADQITGLAIRRLCLESKDYDPQLVSMVVRAIVGEAKRVGTTNTWNAAKAALREIYMDAHGEDPVGKRDFRKWVERACSENGPDILGVPTRPITNVTPQDGFDAQAGDIT